MTTSTAILDAVQEPIDGVNYRLDVLAAGAVDVVCSAGGWLYDRAAAGWSVNVFVPHDEDLRPLHILGVRIGDLGSGIAPHPSASHGLAVSAAAGADPRVRQMVSDASANVLTGLTLWGDGLMTPDRELRPARHVLSSAARRFKRHALDAVGRAAVAVGPTEEFRSDAGRYSPVPWFGFPEAAR